MCVCVCVCVCVCNRLKYYTCVCNRLKAELVMAEEGHEPKDLCSLIGDKDAYDSLLNGVCVCVCLYWLTCSPILALSHSLIHSLTYSLPHSLTRSLTHSLPHSLTASLIHSPISPPPPPPPPTHTHQTLDTRLVDYTPRLFELSSTTGEFVSSEVVYNARGADIEAGPFLQDDVYAVSQPGVCVRENVCVCAGMHMYSTCVRACVIHVLYVWECVPLSVLPPPSPISPPHSTLSPPLSLPLSFPLSLPLSLSLSPSPSLSLSSNIPDRRLQSGLRMAGLVAARTKRLEYYERD